MVGIDIIPAQPPKGVSTIQGNFLSPSVQQLVKDYLVEFAQKSPALPAVEPSEDGEPIVAERPSYIDAERSESVEPEETVESDGKLVDVCDYLTYSNHLSVPTVNSMLISHQVVLSDMSAPWMQTTGFSSNTLSNPYSRMMNTSGMSFRDHAGSMVS